MDGFPVGQFGQLLEGGLAEVNRDGQIVLLLVSSPHMLRKQARAGR